MFDGAQPHSDGQGLPPLHIAEQIRAMDVRQKQISQTSKEQFDSLEVRLLAVEQRLESLQFESMLTEVREELSAKIRSLEEAQQLSLLPVPVHTPMASSAKSDVPENINEQMPGIPVTAWDKNTGDVDETADIGQIIPTEPSKQKEPDSANDEIPAKNDLTLSRLSSHKLMQIDEVSSARYQFQESMWDCCAFIGFPCVSTPDSLMVVFGSIANCTIQILFCFIILTNMSDDPIVEGGVISGAKHWRGNVGHDVRYADPLKQVSLVAQVCASSSGLHLSAGQNQMYGDMDSYLNSPSMALKHLNGLLLCNLAVLIFFWAMYIDAASNTSLALAMWTHPCGESHIQRNDDDQLSIVSVSRWQVIMVTIFAVLPRMFVEAVLFYAGTLFLVYTPSLSDLVLNAVALAFILDIDEISFSVLAPHRIKVLLSEVGSIRANPTLRRIRSFQFDMSVLSCVLLSVLAIVLVNNLYLEPFYANMQQVHDWLCAGDTDFVYTVDKASGIALYARSNPYEEDFPPSLVQRSILAVADVGGAYNLSADAAAMEKSDYSEILTLFNEGTAFAAKQFKCIDHLSKEWVAKEYNNDTSLYWVMRKQMKELTKDSSVESCSDVPVKMCLEFNAVRAACAVRCGCTLPYYGIDNTQPNAPYHAPDDGSRRRTILPFEPGGGLAFATSTHGCPGQCASMWQDRLFEGTDKQNEETRSRTGKNFKGCADLPKELLLQMHSWQNYSHSLGVLVSSLFGNSTGSRVKEILLTQGCKGVQGREVWSLNVCNAGSGAMGRTPRPWCPEACDCQWTDVSDRSECPLPCHDKSLQWDRAKFND